MKVEPLDMRSNNRLHLTAPLGAARATLEAAPRARCRSHRAAGERGVLSSERRNISAMIRAEACSGRPGWSVNGRATQGA